MNCHSLIECCNNKDWNALEQNVRKLSEAINKREYEIGQVIADLRSMLTSTEEETRSHGMKTVSLVLLALDCDILNDAEVSCILQFFQNRLKDRAPVIENSLPGLKALCQFSHFTFEMATSLFYTVQNDVAIQLLKPEFKQQLYKIIKQLFDRFKLDFISLGSNFIYGFLRIVDSETSPTCLVDVFEFFHDIAAIKKFDLFKEDLFEAMACYFPIIYNKQKNDKHLETKIHLSKLLNRAMSATSSFAEYVIQLALEKLESESIGSKQSCYQLLQCALPNYTATQVEPFIHELWTFIRIDSLKPATNESDDLSTDSLLTLTKLSDILVSNPTVCTPFLEKIWKDLEISLKSPELNLINSSINIFVALSSSNHDVFNFYFERSHPILLQNFLFNNIVKHQRLCLDALYQMLIYGKKIGVLFDSETVVRFFNLLIDHCSNDVDLELQQSALQFLNELACVHQFEEAHIAKLVNYLFYYADESNYKPSLLNPVFDLIKNISIHNSHKVLSLLIDPLRAQLESIVNPETPQLQNRLIFHLCALRSASQEQYIFNNVADFLVTKLVLFSKDIDNEFYEMCSLNLLETLQICFDSHSSSSEFVYLFHRQCICPLLDHFTRFCFEENMQLSLQMIHQFSVLFTKFLCKIDTKAQEEISFQMVRLAVEKNISELVVQREDSAPLTWARIEPNSLNVTQIHFFLSLINSYFSSSSSSSSANVSQTLMDIFHRIMSYCFEFALAPESMQSVIDLTCATLSQIVVRLDSSDQQSHINQLSEELMCQLKSRIHSEETSEVHKTVAINILMWTARSLFVRNHPLFNVYVDYFLQLLEKDILTTQVLKLVHILYNSGQDHLQESSSSSQVLIPTENFSINLHQQILDRYNESKKCEFLFLFVSHLRFIPQDVFAAQVESLLPIILNGLEVSQFSEVNLVCLAFIESILKSNYGQVQPHIVSVFRSVIQLARTSGQLKTRKKALDCICLIIDLSTNQDLVNLKVEFLRNLRPTLADHKRLVRASAVKAFCKLSMLGQPGNNTKL